jgi:hypothetical protein
MSGRKQIFLELVAFHQRLCGMQYREDRMDSQHPPVSLIPQLSKNTYSSTSRFAESPHFDFDKK